MDHLRRAVELNKVDGNTLNCNPDIEEGNDREVDFSSKYYQLSLEKFMINMNRNMKMIYDKEPPR